ncbi:MAG: glycosyltransferase [Planctomycetaceae bacterium]|jgi:glycosyltransferase involved in cell wall biosynthesis|nr:glycosyltransferase [Planctomycetaceae bacterium]
MNTIVPKISIIIPVYNVELYLRDCLDSVVNQTMQEIQIICINDGSTDDSLKILNDYASRDCRILIIDKPNAGVSSARNVGLKHTKGKYILFVDSDDTVDIKLCEKVYAKAEQSNADFVLFFYDTPNGHHNICDNIISLDDKITLEEKKTLLSFGTVCGKLWRMDFMRKNDLKFHEQVHNREDTLFYWEGLLLATKISILPEVLYHYYVRENSLSSFQEKQFQKILDDLTKYRLLLKKKNLYQLCKTRFLRFEIDLLFNFYPKIENELKLEFREKLKKFLDEDEKDYLRRERYIDYTVTYFYYCITRDWRIFLMFIRRRIRSFLGTSKRNIIKFVVNFIKKFKTANISKKY